MNLHQLRLRNLSIAYPHAGNPASVVERLGAIQAQDYPMSKWAVGLRLQNSNDADIEASLDAGALVRTHVLRPTWHLVSAADVRWMLSLTAPHIRRSMAAMNRQLELDAKIFVRTARIIETALRDGGHLSRGGVMEAISRAGIAVNPLRAAHLMMEAELCGLVCNGRRQAGKPTYALLEQQCTSPAPVFNREEALHQLALRYYGSHGPATVSDFAWWSGLPAGDARLATAMVRELFEVAQVNGTEYFFGAAVSEKNGKNAYLLPAFDEYLVGYKDRSAVLAAEHNRTIITVNGLFRPVIVSEGMVVGQWFLRQHKTAREICLAPFDADAAGLPKSLDAAIRHYRSFIQTAVTLI